MPAIPLSNASLPDLRPPVCVPVRRPTSAGIVHLGLGGFHRAHMARATHDVMQARPDMLGWGIVGAGLMPGDRLMRDSLVPQDCLYTLMERASATETVTVVGSLVDVLFAAEDSRALLEAIDQPSIRIVSLTVTENGYCLDHATKRLDPAHPLILRDLAQPGRPSSAVGIIVEACRRRWVAGAEPFTVLSCDNIQHNGEVLREAVLTLAALRDPALAAWIDVNIPFPSTMVDRITPVTSDADRAALAERYGIVDRWPVVSERFSQWVIEDRFARGRPAWEEAGAQFVADVAPYEFMKLRLLNASHLAVSGLGRLMGYVTIDEAMADPLMTRYMAALMERETGPSLPPVPGIDLAAYKATLIERFANTAIKDTVERVNTDAPLNILLDPIHDRLGRGEDIELLALALAAWLRRVRGVDEQGGAIDVRHPLAAELRARAEQGEADPGPLLAMTPLFGSLGQQQALVRPVARWLLALYGGQPGNLDGGVPGAGLLMMPRPPGQVRRRSGPARAPVFEHVVTEACDSFLWRQDDYPCERNAWNVHPEIEIHLITNAAGITLVGDHIGRFEPGHLSVIGSNIPHDWVTELPPGEVIKGRDVVLQFDAGRVAAATAAFPELAEVAGFLALAKRGLMYHGDTRRRGADILLAMGRTRGIERLSLFMQLLELLSRSGEGVALSSETFAPAPGATGAGASGIDADTLGLVQRVLAHVFENVTGELHLADVAALGGMSESRFSRFFKRATGNSFTDHVTKLRISRACDLLANSGLPVTDICYEVGYANISNFNRNFRRQRGSTPTEYRRLARRRAG